MWTQQSLSRWLLLSIPDASCTWCQISGHGVSIDVSAVCTSIKCSNDSFFLIAIANFERNCEDCDLLNFICDWPLFRYLVILLHCLKVEVHTAHSLGLHTSVSPRKLISRCGWCKDFLFWSCGQACDICFRSFHFHTSAQDDNCTAWFGDLPGGSERKIILWRTCSNRSGVGQRAKAWQFQT